MGLSLSAIRHADRQLDAPVTTPLSQGRCTIGRSQEADIVLEDPSRHISRIHAVITGQGDQFVLSVESKVNPVLVNGIAVNAGQTRLLASGDELSIGDYVFAVVPAGGPVVPPRSGVQSPAPPPTPVPESPLPRRETLDDILGSLPSSAPATGAAMPLDRLFDDRPIAPAPDFPGRGGAADGGPSVLFGGGADPFLRPDGGSGIDALLRGGGSGADPLGLSEGRAVRGGSGFSDGGRGSDHVQAANLPFTPPPVQEAATAPPRPLPRVPPVPPAGDGFTDLLGPGAAGDPLGLLGDPADAPAPAVAPAPPVAVAAPPPDLAGFPEVPPEERTGASPYVPAIDGRTASGIAAAAALFLKGAGMEGVQIDEERAEAALVEWGALCRVGIEGIMALLLARATMRMELRAADRTMIAAHENNPLKMMESADEAIRFVFDPGQRAEGFLAPPAAVEQACRDLQAHEIAIMAGMRSAIMGSLKRFEPPAIEKRYDLSTGGKSSLLANRKAKLWEFFESFHAKTVEDAHDSFERVFGADFLRAYMEQVKRLQ